ncbi:hypothetical protein O181_089271 [Austropuccinia psidii MF-1]|uniref:Chromo domain-containing protein n=1 Tax=Austropuccinia psidii MF-1 TaxID=1389203 RepID=A0A9Q3ITA0_9BASI|nr:hypothetical protein [Austropuccinia psidii MF-1]
MWSYLKGSQINRKKNFRFSEWAPERGTPDSGNTNSEGTETPILGISFSELHIEFFNAVMKTYSKHKQCGILLQLLQQKYRNPELEPQRNTCTGRERVESPISCGSPEEESSDHSPTAKDFYEMWKRACDTSSKFIVEEKEYNKQRWDKAHMQPDFKEESQVLVSTLNFNNLKGPKKTRDSFVRPFNIIKLIGKNAVEVKLTEKSSRKHPIFPVFLVKQYFQTEEDKFPSKKKNPTPPQKVEVEDSPGPVKKIIKARKIRLNGKDQRQYLVRFKNLTADKNKWLAEDAITDGNLHFRRFRDSGRTEKSHQ